MLRHIAASELAVSAGLVLKALRPPLFINETRVSDGTAVPITASK
jgi:hypothetical protein